MKLSIDILYSRHTCRCGKKLEMFETAFFLMPKTPDSAVGVLLCRDCGGGLLASQRLVARMLVLRGKDSWEYKDAKTLHEDLQASKWEK